jgi:hypothetical protein
MAHFTRKPSVSIGIFLGLLEIQNRRFVFTCYFQREKVDPEVSILLQSSAFLLDSCTSRRATDYSSENGSGKTATHGRSTRLRDKVPLIIVSHKGQSLPGARFVEKVRISNAITVFSSYHYGILQLSVQSQSMVMEDTSLFDEQGRLQV